MVTASSSLDYARLCRETDPWASIPARYNLGHALTRGNVEAGLGERVCLRWENSRGETRQFTYAEIDEASSRLASALQRLGVKSGDRVLLRLLDIPISDPIQAARVRENPTPAKSEADAPARIRETARDPPTAESARSIQPSIPTTPPNSAEFMKGPAIRLTSTRTWVMGIRGMAPVAMRKTPSPRRSSPRPNRATVNPRCPFPSLKT